MPSLPRLLLVDDDPSMCELLHAGLTRRGFDTSWQTSAIKALDQLRVEEFDVVITDLHMEEMDGLELCDRIVSNRPDISVVMMTAHGRVDAAVAALRARAHDFLIKPFELNALVAIIESVSRDKRVRQTISLPQPAYPMSDKWPDFVGASPSIIELRDVVARVAAVDTSVLVTGESGTGKELVARAIHQSSRRAKGPFVALNCAAVPETLLEAELFGHVKGAFTDARSERQGLFVEARGGTFFLDEIAELHLHLQPKLLRAIQERVIRPVGSTQEVPCDVRIITATNRDLGVMVRQKLFREDLYYRLNVIDVHVPPLRERDDDVLLCAQYFVERFAVALGKPIRGLSPEAAGKLLAHAWPGNVRELQNTIERAVALTRTDHITVDDLPEFLRRYNRAPVRQIGSSSDSLVSLEELEWRHICAVMEATRGNRTAAAEILGVDRRTLLRKEARFGPPSTGRQKGSASSGGNR